MVLNADSWLALDRHHEALLLMQDEALIVRADTIGVVGGWKVGFFLSISGLKMQW